MKDILACDRVGTVRSTDEDGRLKVSRTPISKANICGYYGREIPDNVNLGLDANKMYYLLRDADELTKAASTFNNLPVLTEHFHVTADNPRSDITVGSTGEGAVFEAPYLYNSLTIWDGDAIDRIKSGEQRELSSSYRYTADMTPGEYEGTKYDGVMRDIRGSHIAIVPDGRAGPDVLVADSKPNTELQMVKRTPSRKDAMFERLRPFLAQDADPEACKKAMDEDDDKDMADDDVDDMADDEDEDLEKSREDRLKEAGFSPDEIAKMCSSLDVSDDECADDEQDEEDRKDESEGEEERQERDRKDREDESEGAKAAMDSAIKAAVREISRKHDALIKAREAVKPHVGVVAMDSAESVYEFALKKAGYNLKNIPKSAYGSMFAQHSKMASAKVETPRLGMDSKAALGLRERFPALKNIKRI